MLRHKKAQQKVVVYTSLDKVFSQPVLEAFEKETGIKALAVYDSEATKTTGLVNRLIAEKDNPRADVFWNSETGRTIVLKQKGILAKYISSSAVDIPDTFKDTDGYWTGFAARCRILIYNTDLLKEQELPKSIFELTEPKWKDKVALAYPLFGTTATHVAALYTHMGEGKAKQYFDSLKANGVMIVDGNASARNLKPYPLSRPFFPLATFSYNQPRKSLVKIATKLERLLPSGINLNNKIRQIIKTSLVIRIFKTAKTASCSVDIRQSCIKSHLYRF